MPTTAKPKRRRLQFSLSALLLAVAALSVWLAKISSEARLQRQVVERIGQLRGDVYYSYTILDSGYPMTSTKREGLHFLRRIIGDDYVDSIAAVDCRSRQFADADLAMVARLPKLVLIDLAGTSVTADGLRRLAAAKQLRWIELWGGY